MCRSNFYETGSYSCQLEIKNAFKLEHYVILGMDRSYEQMFCHVFIPILERYGVPKKDRHYIMAFYIHGIMAIISEWLRTDCDDSIEYIIKVIQQCVKRRREKK